MKFLLLIGCAAALNVKEFGQAIDPVSPVGVPGGKALTNKAKEFYDNMPEEKTDDGDEPVMIYSRFMIIGHRMIHFRITRSVLFQMHSRSGNSYGF